jgi:hypothetical protein
MAPYERQAADNHLRELTVMLSAWEGNRESDSVEVQNIRSREMAAAMDLTEHLVYGVGSELEMQLSVGGRALEAYQFSRGQNPTGRARRIKLEAGSDLPLRSIRKFYNIEENRCDMYVGNARAFVTLGSVAVAIRHNGGELSFAELDTQTAEQSAA